MISRRSSTDRAIPSEGKDGSSILPGGTTRLFSMIHLGGFPTVRRDPDDNDRRGNSSRWHSFRCLIFISYFLIIIKLVIKNLNLKIE